MRQGTWVGWPAGGRRARAPTTPQSWPRPRWGQPARSSCPATRWAPAHGLIPACADGGCCAPRRCRNACQLRTPPGDISPGRRNLRGRNWPGPAHYWPALVTAAVPERQREFGSFLPSEQAQCGSDGEAVAPLESPRLQDGPTGPSGHALAKAVRLGSLAGIWLVSALHVIQPFTTLARLMRRGVAEYGPLPEYWPFSHQQRSAVHVRRDLPIPTSRTTWHGVPSTNYPHGGTFRSTPGRHDGRRGTWATQ
jgi:hypothetical protein